MRAPKKTALILLLGAAAVVLIAVAKRYELVDWYLKGNKRAQEEVILQILDTARPVIESEFKMTVFQKIFKAIAGGRKERVRQADALKDVRAFTEAGFANHRLKFDDVHRLESLNGFVLKGFDFALGWNGGEKDEIVAVFEVNFWKREIGRMQINKDCGFFKALRLYVEKRAQVN
jgi:hypothetical protein